jgi:XTP/dITP diphosphohydrolase
MEPAVTRTLAPGCRLLLASHNPGKVHELRALLAPHDLQLLSAGELGLPEPEETGSTFLANAHLKAVAAARSAQLPALADDSGLEVAALDGAPGIHSARWAGRTKDFAGAMDRVRREVMTRGGWTAPGPHAKFTAVLCLAWPDDASAAFAGEVSGRLVWPPRGDKGFGYDPMFIADGHSLTFGEMEPDAKHAISHRARAFEAFCRACLEPSRS